MESGCNLSETWRRSLCHRRRDPANRRWWCLPVLANSWQQGQNRGLQTRDFFSNTNWVTARLKKVCAFGNLNYLKMMSRLSFGRSVICENPIIFSRTPNLPTPKTIHQQPQKVSTISYQQFLIRCINNGKNNKKNTSLFQHQKTPSFFNTNFPKKRVSTFNTPKKNMFFSTQTFPHGPNRLSPPPRPRMFKATACRIQLAARHRTKAIHARRGTSNQKRISWCPGSRKLGSMVRIKGL